MYAVDRLPDRPAALNTGGLRFNWKLLFMIMIAVVLLAVDLIVYIYQLILGKTPRKMSCLSWFLLATGLLDLVDKRR